MSFKKLDSRNVSHDKIQLSSLQAEDMQYYNLSKQDLVDMCWKELSKKLKIEEYDYRKNKNIYNSLRVIARDITLLIRNHARAIVFKGAVYNPLRNKVELVFNNISELPDHLKKNMKIHQGDYNSPIIDLILAIDIFVKIKEVKKLTLPDYMTEIYSERYQKHVLPINLIQDPDKKNKAILSITSFDNNEDTSDSEGTKKPTEASNDTSQADDLPYTEKSPEEPLREAYEEESETKDDTTLDDMLDVPVFVNSEKTANKFKRMSSILRKAGEGETE